MRLPAYTLAELAEHTGTALHGNADLVITSVATLQDACEGEISFLSNPRYRQLLPATRASAVILAADALAGCPVAALVSDNPYLAYARCAELFEESPPPPPGIHKSAVVADGAMLGDGVSIGANCVIEEGAVIGARTCLGPGAVVARGASIGADSRIHANVTVCHQARVGSRVTLHPGVVIGSDGFGIANDGGDWRKVPQLGGVRIGDDVEIGANSTVDRGALADTVIGDGVKIDNQVQVGHNVWIGPHSAIAGCVGISGSARIGQHCMIGGGSGILGHLEIADETVITAMSLVTRSIRETGVYSSALPVRPAEEWNRSLANLNRMDALLRRIELLEAGLRQQAGDGRGNDDE